MTGIKHRSEPQFSTWFRNTVTGGSFVLFCLALTAAHGEPLEVHINSKGFSQVKDVTLPDNLATCESLNFRISGAPGAIEVQLLEADGCAKFWRRVDIADSNETAVSVPLRFMRRDGSRSPRWDKVRHFGIYFRNPGRFVLDDFTFRSQPGTTAEIGTEELARIAFPDATVHSVNKPDMALLTDCKEMDLPAMEGLLGRFIAQARRDFPFLGAAGTPPVLLVFLRKDDYEQFTPRFTKLLNSTAAPPTSNGYTIHGIATSYWEPEKGTTRPVYLHEFTHAWFERVAALPGGGGGWLQEGLANHYQLEFHPQDNFSEIVRDGISKPNFRMPLRELCSGNRIPMNRYWQAATVVRMMLALPEYQEKSPSVFEGKPPADDWEAFEHDWLEHCRRTCGTGKEQEQTVNP